MRFRYFIFALVILAPTVNSVQTLKEIMTPPADSADRENLKIWVPVERTSTCRMTINILNSNGEVIRHLVDALIPSGYHNFYWDKKDDSGEYLISGDYKYRIEDCVEKDSGKVLVEYGPNEIFATVVSWLNKETTIWSAKDSISVRIELFELDDSLMVFELDTTLTSGNHFLDLSKRAKAEIGGFRETVIIDGKKVKESFIESCR